METFYYKTKKDSRRSFKLIGFAAAAVVFLAVLIFFNQSPVAGWFVGLIKPFLGNNLLFGSGENEQLKNENAALKDYNEFLTKENELLRGIETLTPTGSKLTAAILSRPPQIYYDTLLIEAGSSQGVLIGDLVVAPPGVALGEIRQVGKETSKAALFSGNGEQVVVLIGTSSISTAAYGQGGQNFYVELPRGVEIQRGDFVSLPGSDPFLLGRVAAVKNDIADPIQTVVFRSAVNLNSIKWIWVIRRLD